MAEQMLIASQADHQQRKKKATGSLQKNAKKPRTSSTMLEAAQRVALMPWKEMVDIRRTIGLAELAKGTVLEVLEGAHKVSMHGLMTVLTCHVDGDSGIPVRVLCPERVYSTDHEMPCIYVYFGKKETKARTAGQSPAHRLVRLSETFNGVGEMRERAGVLREMTFSDLEMTVGSIRAFRDFEKGTVLVLDSYRVVVLTDDAREVIVVKYSSSVFGSTLTPEQGEVYFPARYREELDACDCKGLAVYRGMGTMAKNGKDFYDICIIAERDASLL